MSSLPIKIKKLFNNKHWQECYVSWLESVHSRSQSHSTIYQYQCILVGFFTDPTKTPADYSRKDIETFLNRPLTRKDRTGQPSSPWTHNKVLQTLASFYKYAQRYRITRYHKRQMLLQDNPCEEIRYSRVPESERDMSEEEARRFFAQIPRDTIIGKRDRALFLTYLYTARRRAEIYALRRGDLEETIFEGGRKGYLYHYKGKGHVGMKSAELPAPAFAAIKEYLEADGRWDNMREDSPIFVGTGRHKTLHKHYVSMLFRKYADAAGLPKTRCVHSFRYLSAYERYIGYGCDLVATAQDLDHQDINTTKHYIDRMVRRYAGDKAVKAMSSKYGEM